ncbi:RHS repeat-associated core domain-containing protein, partial [Methylobacterium sp. Leaf100]|uniref:RHS repeat-associated core domain-containing protein n=1 Tax=Methylobacterium sp. Leaf100 TaxID=1736252 RepID=UPI00190FF7F8
AAAQVCPIRFQGQWEDFETGLSYNRFRHYDGLISQYLSSDPIGIDGGTRQYSYVVEPHAWIDPLGLAPKTWQTYTKPSPDGGAPYVGRTSGCCEPEKNVARRDRNHHMNDKDFGPAELDKSSVDRNAVRGREQQLIDHYGRAQSQGGSSSNSINSIRPGNPNRQKYLDAAKKAFER